MVVIAKTIAHFYFDIFLLFSDIFRRGRYFIKFNEYIFMRHPYTWITLIKFKGQFSFASFDICAQETRLLQNYNKS